VTDVVLAIDGKGAVLKSSAYDYMKYRIPADLVERFLEQFDFIWSSLHGRGRQKTQQ